MKLFHSACGRALVAASFATLSACNTAPASSDKGASVNGAPAGKVVVNDVVWPDPAAIDPVVAALPEEAASRVRSSRVPVLVPARREMLAAAKVVAKETWTTVSMRTPAMTVVVTASRAAHRVPGVGPAKGNRKVRSTHGFVTQNEGIWSASWGENGVAYSVEVECADPSARACADEAAVLALAEDLVFAGGAGAAEVSR